MAEPEARVVLPEPVESAMPWRGPCLLCGGPDARHRELDAIQDRVDAGDDEEDVASDHDLTVEVVRFIVNHWIQFDQAWSTDEVNKCGTYAGWNRHRAMGATPCEACRDARNTYMRDYRDRSYVRERERRDNSARRKAKSRLARAHPDEYRRLYAEERGKP